MLARLAKYLAVYGLAMVKPVLAPTVAFASGLHIVESIVLSTLGIISSVTIVAMAGERIRAFFAARRARLGKPEPVRTMSPRVLAVWDRYGVAGIAFITPLLLSPPGGGFAAAALGISRARIITHVAWAGTLWSTVYSVFWYFFGDAVS